MATLKEKRNQGVGGIQMPRQIVERYVDSSELRGIFKELRERLSAIAESEARTAAYGAAQPDHQ